MTGTERDALEDLLEAMELCINNPEVDFCVAPHGFVTIDPGGPENTLEGRTSALWASLYAPRSNATAKTLTTN